MISLIAGSSSIRAVGESAFVKPRRATAANAGTGHIVVFVGVAAGSAYLPLSNSSFSIFWTSELWTVTVLPVRASLSVEAPLPFCDSSVV
jgi:hypothetical protein